MSESGVIPPPGDRTPGARFLGYTEDIDGLRLYIGPHHDRVCLETHDVHLCFAKDAREQFMRLWCEAERQAEAAHPKCKTCLDDGWIEVGVIPRPWQGWYIIAAEGKRIAVGVQDGEVLIGPSLYTEPMWRLDQERAEEFAQVLIRAAWGAEATMPP